MPPFSRYHLAAKNERGCHDFCFGTPFCLSPFCREAATNGTFKRLQLKFNLMF
jgi:hypothetical protein